MPRILKDQNLDFISKKMVNFLMVCGKKKKAQRILKESLQFASLQLKREMKVESSNILLFKAILNAAPDLKIKSKRIGSNIYQIPKPITQDEKFILGIKNVIEAAHIRKENTIIVRLGSELIDAFKNKGTAIKKKDELHKLAELNKSFAHFNF
jgi:small subunit ribosomal protein S7